MNLSMDRKTLPETESKAAKENSKTQKLKLTKHNRGASMEEDSFKKLFLFLGFEV